MEKITTEDNGEKLRQDLYHVESMADNLRWELKDQKKFAATDIEKEISEVRRGGMVASLDQIKDSMRKAHTESIQTHRKSLIKQRDYFVEIVSALPDCPEKLEYQKLIIDCDQYLPEEDRSKELE